jgi:hypothetical protein
MNKLSYRVIIYDKSCVLHKRAYAVYSTALAKDIIRIEARAVLVKPVSSETGVGVG